jgi:hypothetical protein
MHQNCQQCTRLWSEYALATRHFLKLEGRLEIAKFSGDRQTIDELTPLRDRAAAERAELRTQITEHERLPQTEAASA